jgi:GntR family transcriptional regulator
VALYIDRTSDISIHDQLCAQLGMQIAEGTLAPGVRLPSLRGLAGRLSIHYNTVLAVYRSLAARGVVVLQEGRGAYVADLRSAPDDPTGLLEPIRTIVETARARGLSDIVIRSCLERALNPQRPDRVMVVNPHPDLLTIYLHELRPVIPFPLLGVTPAELTAMRHLAPGDDVCHLTSTNHATALREQLGANSRISVFKLASTEALIQRVRALPPDAYVAVVSDSPRIRVLFRELLAGAWSSEQIITAGQEDDPATQSTFRLASLVVTDSLSEHALLAFKPPVPIWRQPLIDSEGIVALTREWGSVCNS